MPVTTTSAAIHIAPVVIKTFLTHNKKKAQRIKNSQSPEDEIAQDDILFDEAFNIVKAFIKLGTKNTIESLQSLYVQSSSQDESNLQTPQKHSTNTHVPAPYWAVICPVTIPLASCNSAADALIQWFGPEELKYVVGGERWWQVRGMSGIDAEWVAEEQDVSASPTKSGKTKMDDAHANILRMEHLDTVMLYIHGGGYFWGSINTHRYQVLHYAQKFKGRAFAVNYRKAPQYPWPCALQDVIAAYLYLIRPPPGAPHNAIPHSKIVFAGDSAGGGLCLTVLTILRDLGLPMPAGAVLISPWVDLTHSFPSVMENYDTDIIPKHGFLAKPSTLWPLPTQPENGGRLVPTVSNPPPAPGKPDTLIPTVHRLEQEQEQEQEHQSEVYGPGKPVKSQAEMLGDDVASSLLDTPSMASRINASSGDVMSERRHLLGEDDARAPESSDELENWEPKPPKVLMENPNTVPLELRSQIQMYATTEQLTHPLVSPILQGSLGNLPPLYIIAGDGEVLRDEIIYLAHKAAHPTDYPTRTGILRSQRQKENAEKFTEPTNIHLQVFDGMCHVLTVFMFTKSAKYVYRSVAEFIKHVSKYDENHLRRNPFPELHRPLEAIPVTQDPELDSQKDVGKAKNILKSIYKRKSDQKTQQEHSPRLEDARRQHSPSSDISMYLENENIISREATEGNNDAVPSSPHKTAQTSDIAGVLMIRERVDLQGKIRPLEPAEALPALQLDVSKIGLIKEAPATRWAEGQNKWDKRYSKTALRVLKQKVKNEHKAERMIRNALQQGFIHVSHGTSVENGHTAVKAEKSLRKKTSLGKIQPDRRWGPLDLENERPPASAIAARRDTPEALALLKKSLYFTAPVTHLTVPKLKASDAFRAAFDPDDDPNKPPPQSASEMQVKAQFIPLHGLRMWDNILRYLGRKSTAKAAKGINATAERVGLA